jgi:hypothetical protein
MRASLNWFRNVVGRDLRERFDATEENTGR